MGKRMLTPFFWLVVAPATPLKNDEVKVSWAYEIPIIYGKS